MAHPAMSPFPVFSIADPALPSTLVYTSLIPATHCAVFDMIPGHATSDIMFATGFKLATSHIEVAHSLICCQPAHNLGS